MEFENYEWYKVGKVTVRRGDHEIIGTDTDWLKSGINKGDVFIVDNVPYEIDEVTGSTSLSLVKEYAAESAGGKDYAIIPRAKAVLLSELALNLAQTVKNWNIREASYQEQFRVLEERTRVIDTLGLYVDDDGDLSQGGSNRASLFSILSAPVASRADTEEMLNEVFSGNKG